MTEAMGLFYRVPRVAAVLDVDPRTVRRGIESGEIPAVRIGNTLRIPATWVRQVAGIADDSPPGGGIPSRIQPEEPERRGQEGQTPMPTSGEIKRVA